MSKAFSKQPSQCESKYRVLFSCAKKKKKKEKKSTTSDSVLIRHKCRTGQGESLVIITINIVCCTVNSQERLHDPNDRAGMKTAEFIFSGAYAKKHETAEK